MRGATLQGRGRYVKPANARQDADAIKQDHHGPKLGLATLRALRALNLGCADNNLAGVRRQCFYLPNSTAIGLSCKGAQTIEPQFV
jgi:hypothetical protein